MLSPHSISIMRMTNAISVFRMTLFASFCLTTRITSGCASVAVCVSHGAQDLDIVRMVAYGNSFIESVLRNILFGCLLGNLQESIELGKALGRDIHCGRA